MSFCTELSNKFCTILNMTCYRLKTREQCDLAYHYECLTKTSKDPKIARALKKDILPEIIDNWKVYASNPRPGKKDMTGGPLERGIRGLLKKQLETLSVTTSEIGEKIPVWEKVSIIADCLSRKPSYPTSIFSVKSWVGPTQIRETFAYAYFSKTWLGQKNIRIHMITLQPIADSLRSLIETCKPYVDGVYSLSGKPYIDELVSELRRVYQ